MQGTDQILSVEDLQISFAGVDLFNAVNKISFGIEKGKTLAIVGESGSGKSLTALALMGLLPKTATQQGPISLTTNHNTYSLNTLTDKAWQTIRGSEISMVFQEPMSSLNPIMKVGRQLVECILAHQPLSKEQAKQAAVEWLDKVQLPSAGKMYDRYPHQLSGGQKQRVMIAMALCNHPVLLIADEPTTALDVTVQQEIIKLMRYLQDEHHTAMIFITHDLALAATIADEALVMYKGGAIEYGHADKVLRNPAEPYTKALLACKPSVQQKGKRLPVVADFLDEGEIKPLQDNTTIIHYPSGNSPILLAADDLRVWFAEEKDMLGKTTRYFKAVDGVSFALNKGETLGLVGESGCGKSTLSRSLIGLLPVHSGRILFNGEDIAHISQQDWRPIRRQVQMIFQDPYSSLNPRMTIGDMLKEPLLTHHIVPYKELSKEALRLLDIVHLPADSLKRYPHQFSGGQRQRIGIARALALRPQLLICDESVSALDVSVQAQILNLLKELQQEFQLTYLFISHDLSVVYYMSDRVMVMKAGKIVESGIAEQVLKHPENSYTQQLINAMPGA